MKSPSQTYPFLVVLQGMRHIQGRGHIDQELSIVSALKRISWMEAIAVFRDLKVDGFIESTHAVDRDCT